MCSKSPLVARDGMFAQVLHPTDKNSRDSKMCRLVFPCRIIIIITSYLSKAFLECFLFFNDIRMVTLGYAGDNAVKKLFLLVSLKYCGGVTKV